MKHQHFPILMCALLLAGCQNTAETGVAQTDAFSGIAETEPVFFAGTEPFWNGSITGDQAIYKTPENIDGTAFLISRFAGNNGISYSGLMAASPFDLMLTPGQCNDGMSDRQYPYVVTLRIGDETREGCGWTQAQPYSEQP